MAIFSLSAPDSYTAKPNCNIKWQSKVYDIFLFIPALWFFSACFFWLNQEFDNADGEECSGGSSPIQEDSLSSCPSLPEVYTLPVRDRPNCPALQDGAGNNLKQLLFCHLSTASSPSQQSCSAAPLLNLLRVCCPSHWCGSNKGLKLSAQPAIEFQWRGNYDLRKLCISAGSRTNWVLLIVTSFGCLSFTVHNDAWAEFNTTTPPSRILWHHN